MATLFALEIAKKWRRSATMLKNRNEMLRRQASAYRTQAETSLGEQRSRFLALADHYEALALMIAPESVPMGIWARLAEATVRYLRPG
jgi:hypothetical protein